MNETISKAVLSGLGLASLTADAIRATAQDLVKRSQLTEEEGKRVVKEFQTRLVEAEKVLEKKVKAGVRTALAQLDLQPARPAKKARTSAKTSSPRGRKNAARAASAH